ncbi:hypothetical protein D0T50_05535 [Bacteroides sp. 214]|uniref:hypothetical protein n=1 Tax=Bacteroides sp. 214 TaxID=2302935 RepID=UPI0013CF41AD|nr:hypothetical protein [Bacteroides sp. 214]NDW12351.1 hypothetical protein [Bacteroides sp. 214]
MKKNKLFTHALAIIAIATTVACTNDDVLNQQPQTPNTKATITATMPAPADTRMSVTDTGVFGAEKLELRWEVGDEIFVRAEYGNAIKATYKIEAATDITNEGKTANFTAVGDVSGVSVTNGKIYFADINLGSEVIVPTYQSANDTQPFGTQKLPMIAKGITIENGVCPSPIAFEHMAYVLKFTFRVEKPLVDVAPQKVMLTAGSTCFSQSVTTQKNSAEFALTDYSFPAGSTNTFDVYIPLFPVANKPLGGILVALEEEATFRGQFNATTNSTTAPFQAGLMYTARIQFDNFGDGTIITYDVFDDEVANLGEPDDIEDYVGDGLTAETAYEISSARQLRKLILEVRTEPGKSYDGKYFKLTKDIHVTASMWTSVGITGIPPRTYPFSGNFDGNGHVITGVLNCYNNKSGFFGQIGSETGSVVIKNLTIAANVESKEPVIGAIIGNITMESGEGQPITISNCHFTGNLTGDNSLGGIVGSSSIENDATGTLTIENCTTRGTITGTGTAEYLGGIVGQLVGKGIVNNCTNYAKITGENGIGGIAGNIDGQNETKITACTNWGSIDGTRDIGGIIGYEDIAQEVSGNANYGTIGNTNASIVGGIAGFADDKAAYINNHNYSPNIYGSSYVGGIWGYAEGNDDGDNTTVDIPQP